MAVATIAKADLWRGDLAIFSWIKFLHVDPNGDRLALYLSAEDIAHPSTYAGGRKESRLVSSGANTRKLSDRRGRVETSSFVMVIADPSRQIRTWFEQARQRHLLRAEVSGWVGTGPDLVNGVEPAPDWHGLVSDFTPIDEQDAVQFTAQDLIAALGANEVVNLWRIGDHWPNASKDVVDRYAYRWYGRYSDSAASATAGPTWQSEAASGATSMLAGYDPMPYGVEVPADIANDDDFNELGIPGPPGVGADAPHPYNAGQNSEGLVYCCRANRIAGQYSDPFPFLPFGGSFDPPDGSTGNGQQKFPAPNNRMLLASGTASGSPVDDCVFFSGQKHDDGNKKWDQGVPTTDPATGVHFNATPLGSEVATLDNITASSPATSQGAGFLPEYSAIEEYVSTWVMPDGETAPSSVLVAYGGPFERPVRMVIGPPPVGAIEARFYRRQRGQTAYTMRWSVDATDPGNLNGDGNLFFVRPIGSGGGTAVSNLPATNKGVVPGIYVADPETDGLGRTWPGKLVVAGHAMKGNLSASSRDVDGNPTPLGSLDDLQISIPGRTGYSARWGSDPFRVVNSHRLTIAFVDGQLNTDLAAGNISVWFNGDGAETVGDSSGLLIEKPLDIRAHLLDNDISPIPLGLPIYAGGDWAASIPQWGDGRATRNADSYAAAETSLAALLPTDVGALLLSTPPSAQSLLASLCVDNDVAQGPDPDGADEVVVESPDPFAAVRTDLGLTYHSEIKTRSIRWKDRLTPDYYFNQLTYTYGGEFDSSGTPTLQTSVTITNGSAVTDQGGLTKRASETLTFFSRRDAASCAVIAQRVLNRASPAPRDASLTTGLFAMAGNGAKLGDLIPVTHPAGPGASGWVRRLLQIRSISTTPQAGEVALSLRGLNDTEINDMIAGLFWYFDGDENVPIGVTSYPSGSGRDKRAAGTNVMRLDTADLAPGSTYAIEVEVDGPSGVAVSAAIINEDDAPDTPLGEASATTPSTTPGVSSAFAFTATAGVTKTYSIKSQSVAVGGVAYGIRLRRVS